LFFLKVNKGWGRGDAGRTSSGRGGASIESSDVTANSSSCGWLSTAWDHPRGGGREGASESGVACGSNEMASAQPVRRKVAGGCPFRRAGAVRGWGRVGRARTCACCRLEFTTLPYSSSEYSNSESPISTAVMERASVCPRDGEAIFPLDRPPQRPLSERTKLLF